MDLFADVDPRLAPELRADYERRLGERVDPLPASITVVLAGHRAAGKSRLLPRVGELLGRPTVDLDHELERAAGRPLREWLAEDVVGFRRAEKETFLALPRGLVVAVGGGFLAAHADALRGSLVVLVPVTFETYVDRLRADTTRPRLLPALSVEDELRELYFERTEKHRAAHPLPLVDFLLRARAGQRPRRVVTLPPATDPTSFAWRARHLGADLLEVRSDLVPAEMELRPAARALPLLVAQRSPKLPDEWLPLAHLVDRAWGDGPAQLVSLHAERPLSTAEALARWRDVPVGVEVKHVEPLGPPAQAARLFETRAALAERFGWGRVTVLATGPLALPFRAALSRRNGLDYLAVDGSWQAADGQRLLEDAVREWRLGRPEAGVEPGRLGILGAHVAHSRSPRLHPQPFDRVALPEDADLAGLLQALAPHYRGFAVTNPFKRVAAEAVQAGRPAVNTLVREAGGYRALNTDVDGAAAVLEALGGGQVTVLGDGGATDALREAAAANGVALEVRRREGPFTAPLSGPVVWTWPAEVEAPEGLRFDGATVAVIAYGAPARSIAARVRALGGVPRRLGPRWFIAQARGQRAAWEAAR